MRYFNILPTCCVLCDAPVKGALDICSFCQKELPQIQSDTLYHDELKIITPFHYAFPIDQFIMRLKFQQQLIYARLLGQLLAQRLKQEVTLPELFIPIPLHDSRLRERGFNQAIEIGRYIKKILHIPMDNGSLIRTRATEAQSLLPAAKRQQNLHNAFALAKPLQAKHVALLDDVMTTGNTVRAAALVLRTAGVEKIDVWCCCKAS